MTIINAWLDERNPPHSKILEFLNLNRVTVLDNRKSQVSFQNFFPGNNSGSINLSQFVATKDSLLYSNLIASALEKSPQLLVDLGTGSAIPVISALLKTNSKTKVMAIDVDTKALQIAQSNLDQFHLALQVSLNQQSIGDFLAAIKSNDTTRTAITSNPPYLPCPETENPEFLPVNGGWDGTRFIEEILLQKHPSSFLIGVQWGSVTNPLKIIDIINNRYDVSSLFAWELPFGRYSLNPTINDHLHSQRTRGESIFFGDKGSDQSQIVFAALLSPKQMKI